MNLYAPILNLDEFDFHNMMSGLKKEVEHMSYFLKRNIDFRIQFSENEDFNAEGYAVISSCTSAHGQRRTSS